MNHSKQPATQRKRLENNLITRYLNSFYIIVIIISIYIMPAFYRKLPRWSIYLLFFGFLAINSLILPLFTGRTLAMFFTKTRIIGSTGGKPTFVQLLKRALGQLLIPFEAVSMYFSRRPAMIHDWISSTKVIYEGDAAQLDEEQGTSAILPDLSKPGDRRSLVRLGIFVGLAVLILVYLLLYNLVRPH